MDGDTENLFHPNLYLYHVPVLATSLKNKQTRNPRSKGYNWLFLIWERKRSWAGQVKLPDGEWRWGSYRVYTKPSSWPDHTADVLVTRKPSFRGCASTAWSWQYFCQRRGLAHFVQLAHQSVGQLDSPVSLLQLAELAAPGYWGPRSTQELNYPSVPFAQCTFQGDGLACLAQACMYDWANHVGNLWGPTTFLLRRLALHNYSYVSVVVPNYLT